MVKVEVNNNGENWWQSRRIWASIAGAIVVGISIWIPEYEVALMPIIKMLCQGFGILLPVVSWNKPK